MNVRVLFLASSPNASTDLNDWRRLRIHLARVHTERECLKQVLRFLDTDRLQFAGYEPAHDRVQLYLNAVFSRLNRPTFDGLPQDSLARAMEDQSEAITEEMRDRVLGQMASARQALQAKAQTGLATRGPIVNYTFEKEVVMTGGNIGGSYNQKVVVGPGGTIQGSVANGVIQDSIKSIESSDANDELKAELKKLTALVQDMVGHLDETQAKRAANQLKTLTDEATAPSPDPKWYSVSSKGLLDAAEFAGEFAGKIGASLASITKILGF
jgi:hypothetical protein